MKNSCMEVISRDYQCRVTAIRVTGGAVGKDGIFGAISVEGGVCKVRDSEHVAGHAVGPFQDLRTDINQKGVTFPPAKDHDLGRGVIGQEERHGGS